MPSKLISSRIWLPRIGLLTGSLAVRVFLLLVFLLQGAAITALPAYAQNSLSISEMTVESEFPDRLTFSGLATGASQIVEAELLYYSPSHLSSVSRTRVEVPVEPSEQADLSYEWDTSGQTIVPNTPLLYQWTVWDADGNSLTSEEQFVRYRDTRFEWQIDENEAISVWTHDRPADFGREVFDLAARAVDQQRELFGEDLTQQIQLIIYNDFGEFADWHSTVGEFIGGQAFPDVGITTQIVPLGGPQAGWLQDVVPHEISHLYFAQATHNPTVSIPVWLNEGLASYNEFGSPQAALNRVERVAEEGRLIPLSSLARGFGSHDEARARLAYDEALSAVVFIVERFGQDSVRELLASYRQGLNSDRAFQRAFAMNVGSFEAAWAEWAGSPPGQYATATPWPFPTFPPSPTLPGMTSAGGGQGTQSAAKTPTSTPSITEAPTSIPESDELSGLGLPSLVSFSTLAGGLVGLLVLAAIVALVILVSRSGSAE